MEILKEGLHTYQMKKEIKNTYYLSVEYEVLKRNPIKSLLSVQLREQDGQQCLLFDITGKQSLKEFRKERGFSFQEIRTILQALVCLIQEIDEYMLDFRYVSLHPEHIYVGENRCFQWMYLPGENFDDENCDSENDIQKSAEEFFSWMLTRADYEDVRGVPLIYFVFGEIRKHGFSRKVLERCIEKYPENKQILSGEQAGVQGFEASSKEQARGQGVLISQEERESARFFQTSSEEKRSERDVLNLQQEKERRQGFLTQQGKRESASESRKNSVLQFQTKLAVRIVLLLLAVGTASVTGMLIFGGIRFGFSKMRYRYIAGSGILTAVFLMAALAVGRRREQSVKEEKSLQSSMEHREEADWMWDGIEEEKLRINSYMPENSYAVEGSYESENSYTTDEGRDMGEEEEGTVVLGVRRQDLYPVLRAKETGIVCTVDCLPFYIGSGKRGNQMQIRNRTVSRRHAVILPGRQTGNYVIQDMESTNGTWVDGVKLEGDRKILLKDGMSLRFARCEYEFFSQYTRED